MQNILNILQGWLVHASLENASDGRTRHWSEISSTRRNGVSHRQNVLCRIFIPVMVSLAIWAIPFTDVQGQRFYDKTTLTTSLAGRKKSVNGLDFFSIPASFVFQHRAEGTKTSVANTSSKVVVSTHSTDVQVFDAKNVKPSHKVSCYFIKMVFAGIGNVRLQMNNLQPLTIPAATPFFSTGKNSLESCKFAEAFPKELVIRNTFSIAECSEAIDAKVNADNLSCFWKFFDSLIEAERDKVLPGTVLGYRNRAGFTLELPRPMDVQSSNFGQTEVSVFTVPLQGRAGKLCCLFSSLRFEPGITGTLLKEVFESGLQMPETLLQGDTGHFIEPFNFWLALPFRQFRTRLMIVDFCFVLPVGIGSQFESTIVNIAHTTKCLFHLTLLTWAWVESEAISNFHTNNIQHVNHVVNQKSALKGGVSTHKI